MSTYLMGLCRPIKTTPTNKSVLVSLADQANDQGYCWPSVATLCEHTCLSERAVRNALRQLEALGILQTEVGAMKSNRYILRVARILEVVEAQKKPPTSGADEASPRHHVPGGTTCRGAPRAGEGGTTCPQSIIEANTNTSPHNPPGVAGGAQAPELDLGGEAKGGASAKARGREKKNPTELAAWLAACKAAGVQPIPAEDAVWTYAARVGIGEDLVALCWREFKRRHAARAKRYRDWAQVFRNCVEANWYGLWYVKPGQGAQLTSQGEQVRRYFEAEDAQAGGEAA